MKTFLRLLTCCGVVVVVLVAVAHPLLFTEHDWRGTGSSGRSNPFTHLLREQQHADELDRRMSEIRRHCALKEKFARQVIAKQVTLLEAAARFHELDQEATNFNWAAFRRAYPGHTDPESQCRKVIALVSYLLENQPGEVATVIARLEAELQEHLDRSGTIQLPDVRP